MARTYQHDVHNQKGLCQLITFCYNRVFHKDNIGYPNLAHHPAQPFTPAWRQFDAYYPRVVPLRLSMYTKNYHIIRVINSAGSKTWYPIGLSWFDFDIDYFDLMSDLVKNEILDQGIKVLFYYHEGDNPIRIKNRLDELVKKHNFPSDCYHFISANTVASELKNFSYFPDHEFFFRHVNRHQIAPPVNPTQDFTALNRLHKWWRASAMCDLQHRGLLDNSIWSYNTANTDSIDLVEDNPIELDTISGWRERTQAFASTTHHCDTLSSAQHNDHHYVNTDLYTNTRCHVVLETLFDVDQSGGAFLTEKTFKAIKYGQPFVIAGGPGSLQALRNMGYRTFDHVINPSYDTIENNTHRWLAIADVLTELKRNPGWYECCVDDLKHNQHIFAQRAHEPVNSLLKELECLH